MMFARLQNVGNPLGKNFAICFNGRLSEELSQTSAKVYRMGNVRLSRPWTVWSARAKLKKILKASSFDAVVCHAMWPHLVFGPVVRGLKIPLVVWAHDAPEQLHWIDRVGMRIKPDLVIANSAYTQSLWNRNYPEVACKVGYYPMPAPKSDAPALVRQRLRETIGASDATTVILIASRFETWKGHSLLFKALSQLKDQVNWECWVVGGAQRDHEKKTIESLKASAEEGQIADRIRWLGSRSDVFDIMLASDIYCQPNLAPEPFGVVFLEAMHAQLAVITSNAGGPREFLDGECGLLIEQGNLMQLTDGLASLLQNPDRRRQIGKSGKQRVDQMFDLDHNMANLHGIFLELIGQKS